MRRLTIEWSWNRLFKLHKHEYTQLHFVHCAINCSVWRLINAKFILSDAVFENEKTTTHSAALTYVACYRTIFSISLFFSHFTCQFFSSKSPIQGANTLNHLWIRQCNPLRLTKFNFLFFYVSSDSFGSIDEVKNSKFCSFPVEKRGLMMKKKKVGNDSPANIMIKSMVIRVKIRDVSLILRPLIGLDSLLFVLSLLSPHSMSWSLLLLFLLLIEIYSLNSLKLVDCWFTAAAAAVERWDDAVESGSWCDCCCCCCSLWSVDGDCCCRRFTLLNGVNSLGSSNTLI